VQAFVRWTVRTLAETFQPHRCVVPILAMILAIPASRAEATITLAKNELALLVEAEFGFSLPRRRFELMRSYGDLIEAVAAALGSRRGPAPIACTRPAFVRTRVVPAAASRGAFERAGELTPYAVENIAKDVVLAGRGARLEVTVPAGTNDAGAAAIFEQLSALADRGVKVSLRRDPHWIPAARASVRAA
jgi:hypothetical protein